MGAEQFTRSFGLTVKDIEQYEDFRQMLSQMFTDMQNHQIHSLVIDLRYNKGGQSIFGYQFLYYLQQLPEVLKDYTGGIQLSPLLQHFNPTYFEEKKQEYEQVLGKEIVNLPVFSVEQSLLTGKQSGHPYTRSRQEFFAEVENPGSLFYIAPPIPRFSGRIFLLIGPKTASSAAYFATIMADNHLATLIGQPLGQKPTHFGDALLFQLPHTGVKGMVSSSLFLRPDATKNDEPTLYPDIEVWPTIDDIMNGRDPVFDKVLELIEQEQEP